MPGLNLRGVLLLADGNLFAFTRLAAGVRVFGFGFTGAETQSFSATDPTSISVHGSLGGNE